MSKVYPILTLSLPLMEYSAGFAEGLQAVAIGGVLGLSKWPCKSI